MDLGSYWDDLMRERRMSLLKDIGVDSYLDLIKKKKREEEEEQERQKRKKKERALPWGGGTPAGSPEEAPEISREQRKLAGKITETSASALYGWQKDLVKLTDWAAQQINPLYKKERAGKQSKIEAWLEKQEALSEKAGLDPESLEAKLIRGATTALPEILLLRGAGAGLRSLAPASRMLGQATQAQKLLTHAPLPALGAMRGGEEGGWLGAAMGGAQGAGLGYMLGAAGQLPSVIRPAAGAAIFGGPTAINAALGQASLEDVFAESIIGAGLTLGGRKVRWHDYFGKSLEPFTEREVELVNHIKNVIKERPEDIRQRIQLEMQKNRMVPPDVPRGGSDFEYQQRIDRAFLSYEQKKLAELPVEDIVDNILRRSEGGGKAAGKRRRYGGFPEIVGLENAGDPELFAVGFMLKKYPLISALVDKIRFVDVMPRNATSRVAYYDAGTNTVMICPEHGRAEGWKAIDLVSHEIGHALDINKAGTASLNLRWRLRKVGQTMGVTYTQLPFEREANWMKQHATKRYEHSSESLMMTGDYWPASMGYKARNRKFSMGEVDKIVSDFLSGVRKSGTFGAAKAYVEEGKMRERTELDKGDTAAEVMQTLDFMSRLDDASLDYLRQVNKMRNKSTLHPNMKTIISGDFSTVCPKKLRGETCPYCYVENARQMNCNAKASVTTPYNNEILQMPPLLIEMMNKELGGMRWFSFGDYVRDRDYKQMASVLADAKKVGLKIKIITKQKETVEDWGNHPNARFNISTDFLPPWLSKAPTIQEAYNWSLGPDGKPRPNIKIRTVAFNREQALMAGADPRVKPLTLYHGPTGEKMYDILLRKGDQLADRMKADPAFARKVREEVDSWEDMRPHHTVFQMIQKLFPEKLCCVGGSCTKDYAKCGFADIQPEPTPERERYFKGEEISEAPEGNPLTKKFYEQFAMPPKTPSDFQKDLESRQGTLTKQEQGLLEQLQSGAIDENTAKIRALVSDPEIRQLFKRKPREVLAAIGEQMVDRMLPLRKFVDGVEDITKKSIAFDNDIYNLARLFPGRFGLHQVAFQELRDIFKPVRKYQKDLQDYAMAEQAKERVRKGIENPEYAPGKHLEAGEAKQAQAEIANRIGAKAYKEITKATNNFYNWADKWILRTLLDAKLISPKLYKEIRFGSKDKKGVRSKNVWLPFEAMQHLDEGSIDNLPVGSEFFSVSAQDIVKPMVGGKGQILPPFESILSTLNKTITIAEKNKILVELVKYRSLSPEMKNLIVPIKMSDVIGDPTTYEDIKVVLNGKVTRWLVPKDLGDTLKNMDLKQSDSFMKLVKASSSLFRAGTTSYYLPFTIGNIPRDFKMALLCNEFGFNPVNWTVGLWHGLRSTFGFPSELFKQYLSSKGAFGGLMMRRPQATVKKLFEPRGKELAKEAGLFIKNIAAAAELAPRLAVFQRAMGQGVAMGPRRQAGSLMEAGLSARQATIDFSKAGNLMKLANQYVPFINARLQAKVNLLTRVANPKTRLHTIAKAVGWVVLPSLSAYFYNILHHKDQWAEIPDYVKDNYDVVILGTKTDEKGRVVPDYAKLTKGDVEQMFVNPLITFLEFVRNKEPLKMHRIAIDWFSEMSPIPFAREGELSFSRFLAGGIPPAFRAPIEYVQGKSLFTERETVPWELKRIAKPEQYTEKTPKPYRWLGKATGGSPLKLQAFAKNIFGSVLYTTDIGSQIAGRVRSTTGGESLNQAYKLQKKAEEGYFTARKKIEDAYKNRNYGEIYTLRREWDKDFAKVLQSMSRITGMSIYQLARTPFYKMYSFQDKDIRAIKKGLEPDKDSWMSGLEQKLGYKFYER